MGKVLISFLGKAQPSAPGKKAEYRRARYRFDGGIVEETSYFGLALTQQIQPDRLVLLGTRGSMWDELFSDMDQGSDEFSERLLELIDKAQHEAVNEDLLVPLTPLLERRIGRPCVPRIIPYGRDPGEQIRILEILAEAVQSGDEVHIDLTHGFRILPMLGLLSALYLRTVRDTTLGGLYYGALDMKDRATEEVPVLRLDGLLTLADWIGAVSRYDQSGDYGVFAPLLAQEDAAAGPPLKALQAAAFHERTSHSALARDKLSTFHQWFEGATLSPVAQLFRAPLAKRLSWWQGKERTTREKRLANDYLQRQDYLRATIFAFEALVTEQCSLEKCAPIRFENRKKAAENLRSKRAFMELEHLRNDMAHGVLSSEDVKKALDAEDKLRSRLKALFETLGISNR
ncbi:MAG: TIGR02221 family CRISPR-associated protein [Magnetococcales bacterium]|nr:TIGR02221 family CRISPR-associated protein [Magnetococcales bacterium]